MNISSIFSNNLRNNYYLKTNKENKIKENDFKKSDFNNLPLITSNQMLAFLGGYTLKLDETFNQLNDEQYPPDIQEMVLEEVINGNPDKKTLYDVHFEKYKGVLDCFSLDELKEKYPEFSEVNSAYDVFAKEDSFIGKFQQKESDAFPYYEDLTLQLIKLYWGQGFSLSDLSKYIAQNSKEGKGINIQPAMAKKLNIPLMHPRYASVLKLSNKEYNEKFTQEMSLKRKEAKEAKEQLAQGEPVVIPRGKLSEVHKLHISQGLKKHFEEHPEKLYKMSERQKRFYEEHPEKKEEMSDIMTYAWNETPEGKSLQKYIEKFAKKYNTKISSQELTLEKDLDESKQTMLTSFWQKNPWACEKLSIAIKKGRIAQETRSKYLDEVKNAKTIPGVRMVFNLAPEKLTARVLKWAQEQNIDTKNLILFKSIISYKEDESTGISPDNIYVKKGKELISKYYNAHPNHADLATTCLHRTLLDLQFALKHDNKKLPKEMRDNPTHIELMKYAYNAACYRNDIPVEENLNVKNANQEIDINQIYQAYGDIMQQAMILGHYEFAEYMDNKLNETYDLFAKLPKFQ